MQNPALMNLTSVFEPDGPIPPRYTCEGRDESPALRWSEVPDNVRTFVLIVDDPDAPGGRFVQALAEGIPPVASIAGGGTQGLNNFGRVGYGGPCPPGGPSHRYVFTLAALDRRLGLAPGKRAAHVRKAMQGHVVAEAQLVERFQRRAGVGRGGARGRRAG